MTITFPPTNQYTVQAELFARRFSTYIPVPIPPEDGVANMSVIERIMETDAR